MHRPSSHSAPSSVDGRLFTRRLDMVALKIRTHACKVLVGASSPWLCSHQDEFQSICYLPLKVREKYFPRINRSTNAQGKWVARQCTKRNLKKKVNKLRWFLLMCTHRVNYLICDLRSKKLKKTSRTVRALVTYKVHLETQGLCLFRFPVFLRLAMQPISQSSGHLWGALVKHSSPGPQGISAWKWAFITMEMHHPLVTMEVPRPSSVNFTVKSSWCLLAWFHKNVTL